MTSLRSARLCLINRVYENHHHLFGAVHQREQGGLGSPGGSSRQLSPDFGLAAATRKTFEICLVHERMRR